MRIFIFTLMFSLFAPFSYALDGSSVIDSSKEKVAEERDNVISIWLENDIQLARGDEGRFSDLSNTLMPSLSYKIFEDNEFSVYTELLYNNFVEEKKKIDLNNLTVGHARDFLLSNLNTVIISSINYQMFLDSKASDEAENYESVYVLLGSQTELKNDFWFEAEMQFSHYLKTLNEEGSLKQDFSFALTPSYYASEFWSLRLSLESSFEFNHGIKSKGYVATTVTPTIGLNLRNNLEIALYSIITPFNSYDGTLLSDEFEKNAIYGCALSYEVF